MSTSNSNPKSLFHITCPKKIDSILREGLRANSDGHIFVITDARLANTIARDQIFLTEYAVLQIDLAGVSGRMEADRVAELAAWWHRIIVQPLIEACFIKHHLTATVETGPTEGDYMRYARMGMNRAAVDEQYRQTRVRWNQYLISNAGRGSA